jgi:hypothetical protein
MSMHIAEPESNGLREINSSDSRAARFINVNTTAKRRHGDDTRSRLSTPSTLGRVVSTDMELNLENQLAVVMRKLETIEVEMRQTRQGSVAQGSNNIEPLVLNDLPPDYESQPGQEDAEQMTESRRGERKA